MSLAKKLVRFEPGPQSMAYPEGRACLFEPAEAIIRGLEAELARKDERIAELESDRDEARQWLINWEWERVGDYWQAQGKTKTDLAEMQWPGQGAHLFPEES